LESSATRPAGRYFSGFVCCGIETAKPEKFVAYRDGGLKGRLQADCLPHEKTKAERRAETRRRLSVTHLSKSSFLTTA